MKILIGVTGLALFLYLIIHIAGNLMVFGGPSFFNKYAYTLESNPLIPVIEIGLLLIFLVHVYKTVTMFLSNQQARPARYAQKKRAGHASRKTLRLVDDDRVGPLAAAVHRHPRESVPLRHGVRVGRKAAGISIAWRWRISRTR